MDHETPPPPEAPRYAYAGPESMRKPIDDALRRVVDPEVAMTIVDVGLVYGVAVRERRVHVQVTMTSAACPVTDLIIGDIEAELARVTPSDTQLDVELVWEPAWSTDRMSARAKAFMGWSRD
ncbi:MAG: metal-sulfur cluster assembly factor [Burkholderiales bacterium]